MEYKSEELTVDAGGTCRTGDGLVFIGVAHTSYDPYAADIVVGSIDHAETEAKLAPGATVKYEIEDNGTFEIRLMSISIGKCKFLVTKIA